MSEATTIRPYVFGHSETELRRLAIRSAFWGELTEEILRRAGIGAGMRVLDIGSGAGDVAILAARLTGPSGSVVGIDRSEDAVKRASGRAAAEGLSWCRFSVADVQAFEADRRFDAVVGRPVMHVSDPARRLAATIAAWRGCRRDPERVMRPHHKRRDLPCTPIRWMCGLSASTSTFRGWAGW